MSEENVEVVRRGLDLFNRGEFEGVLREVIHPEIELTPGIGPLLGVGTIRGREEVLRFWRDDLPQGLDEFQVEPLGFEDFGEKILVDVRYRARGPASDMDIEQQFATIYSFEGGLIQSIHDYPTRSAALEAAGLSE